MHNFFLQSEITRDSNGNIVRETNYNYDENGNLTNINIPLRALFASNSTFTYDENNNLIRQRFFSLSNNFSTESITDFVYDENNNLSTETRVNGFGDPLSITINTYDDDNNLILQSIDSNADGIVNTEIGFTYDDNNNLLIQTNNSLDNDLNITVNTYSYDDNNNLISESTDINFDGALDFTSTYIYDENNNLITESTDFDLDGIPENTTTNTYDNNNNLITIEFESDSRSGEDSIIRNTYDNNNNLITSALDVNRDGTIQTITENSYIKIEGLETEEIDESHLSLTEVHRFYQYQRDTHFYSADSNEIVAVRELSDSGELAYNYEAEKYRVLADNRDTITGETIEGVRPVYRFFNTETGAHLYITDEIEKDSIENNLTNYNFEGIKYYAFEQQPENLDTIPVYRMLNTASGAHFFSSDEHEIDLIVDNLPNFSMENGGNAAFYVFEL